MSITLEKLLAWEKPPKADQTTSENLRFEDLSIETQVELRKEIADLGKELDDQTAEFRGLLWRASELDDKVPWGPRYKKVAEDLECISVEAMLLGDSLKENPLVSEIHVRLRCIGAMKDGQFAHIHNMILVRRDVLLEAMDREATEIQAKEQGVIE